MSEENAEKIISTPVADSTTTFFGDVTRDIFAQMINFFPDTWAALASLFGGNIWFLILSVIMVITFLADLFFRVIFHFINAYLDRRKKPVIKIFTVATHAPISFYIWLSGSVLALNTVIATFKVFDEMMPYINGFKSTFGVMAVAWFAIRLVHRIEVYVKQLELKDSKWDPVSLEAIAKIAKLTIFIITGLFVLSSLGVNLTGLIAFGGVGGIAVGFAAKDFIGNVIGGLMLYLDKPFATGEWIRSPDKNIEGIVESIGWRMTIVRTFDKRPLYIPNGTFSTISIENPSRMTHRRIKEHVGIRYGDIDKMEKIVSEIRQMLTNHPVIASDQIIIVNFDVFNSSSLDIFIYCFTKTTVWLEYHQARQDVFMEVTKIVKNNGAEFAFPSRSLYIEESSVELPPFQLLTTSNEQLKNTK